MYILGLRLQYIKSTISTSSQICFSLLSLMFQTATPIHYPFLSSQLLAFPRGSLLISTYP